MAISSWLKRSVLIAAGCMAALGLAHAGTKVNIGSMTADGQEVRNLSCNLESGGFFGGIAIVGGLAKQKKAFDACAKDGAAFKIEWKWDGSKAKDLKVSGGTAAQNTCISTAFSAINGPVKGSCSAVLLVGKKDKAQKAADAIGGGGSSEKKDEKKDEKAE